MPRERDEYEIEDFGTRMAKQSLGGNSALELPQGLSLFKPKKSGSLTLDIVPFQVTENHLRFRDELRNSREGRWYPERTYHTHRNIGVNGETFACLAMNFGERCPICEARAELKKSPHKDDSERSYELKPKDRQLWLAYDNDDPDRGVQLWDVAVWNFGRHVIKYVEGARKEDRDAYKAFYHPVRGFTMRITATVNAIGAKDGKKGGENTEYTVHQFYARTRPLPDHIINHGYDMDAMIRKFEYKALKELYLGVADVEDASTDPDGGESGPENPGPRSYQSPAPRSPARDERPPVEDDAPPARPTRKPTAAPPPPEPDEDAPIPCATGDIVSFEYRGETYTGEVVRIDQTRQVAHVQVEGAPRPNVVPFEDVTLVEADATFDPPPVATKPKPAPEPARKPAKAPAEDTKVDTRGAWDDDDSDGRSAPPARPAKKPTSAPPPSDDDDAPPTKRRR